MKHKYTIGLTLSLLGQAAFAEDSQNIDLESCLDQQPLSAACQQLIKEECGTVENCTLDLDDVTVVGTRTEVSINKYPGSANRITADDINDSSSVIESLSKIPGVETGDSFGRNIGQQYSIRGFGYQSEDRVIIKLDGVRRSTSMFSNHISTFKVDNDLLTSIDVIKGSSSIAHGGGAIGGVVGMTTKDAYSFLRGDQNFGVTVKGRYETNNHKDAYLAVYGAVADDKFDYLLYKKRGNTDDLTMSNGDNIDNNEDFDNHFVKVGFNPNLNHRFTLSHFKMSEDTEVTWQTLWHSTYSTITGPVVGNLEQEDTVFSYTGSSEDTDLFNMEFKAYHSKSHYFRALDYERNGTNNHVDYTNFDKHKGFNVKNLMLFDTGSISHRFLLGVDYEVRNEDALYIRNGVTSDFGSMPNEYKDLGVYIQEEAHMFDDTLTLFLGGRYDSFKRDVHGGEKKYDNDRFSPRIGFAVQVFEGFNILGNVSESFRAPTPHETSSEGELNPHYWYLANPNLKAETAREYELGFSYVANDLWAEGDEFWFKTMYFRGKIDQMIRLRTLSDQEVTDRQLPSPSPSGAPYATYDNVTDARRKGLELQARYSTGPWKLGLTYETLDQYNAENGEKVPYAFADKIRVSGEYNFFEQGISIGMNVSRWLKPDQNPKTYVAWGTTYTRINKPYTIGNMYARWRPHSTGVNWLDGGLELELGVNNMTDQDKVHPNNRIGTTAVGKGRNVYMTVVKRF